jgi:hypothetical protein
MIDITNLLDDYDDAVETLSAAEKILNIAKLEVQVLEMRLIEYMEIYNMDTIEWEGKKLTKKIELYPSILVKDTDKLKEFLGDNIAQVFTETPSKIKSYFRKQFDSGNILPDFLKIHSEQELKFKKPKNKKGK